MNTMTQPTADSSGIDINRASSYLKTVPDADLATIFQNKSIPEVFVVAEMQNRQSLRSKQSAQNNTSDQSTIASGLMEAFSPPPMPMNQQPVMPMRQQPSMMGQQQAPVMMAREGYNVPTSLYVSEGMRSNPSLDTTHQAIGFGHNLSDEELRRGTVILSDGSVISINNMSEEDARRLARDDYNKNISNASNVFKDYGIDFNDLPPIVQDQVGDLIYNIGPGNFKNNPGLLTALSNKDYSKVAEELMTSGTMAQGEKLPGLVTRATNRSQKIIDMIAGSNTDTRSSAVASVEPAVVEDEMSPSSLASLLSSIKNVASEFNPFSMGSAVAKEYNDPRDTGGLSSIPMRKPQREEVVPDIPMMKPEMAEVTPDIPMMKPEREESPDIEKAREFLRAFQTRDQPEVMMAQNGMDVAGDTKEIPILQKIYSDANTPVEKSSVREEAKLFADSQYNQRIAEQERLLQKMIARQSSVAEGQTSAVGRVLPYGNPDNADLEKQKEIIAGLKEARNDAERRKLEDLLKRTGGSDVDADYVSPFGVVTGAFGKSKESTSTQEEIEQAIRNEIPLSPEQVAAEADAKAKADAAAAEAAADAKAKADAAAADGAVFTPDNQEQDKSGNLFGLSTGTLSAIAAALKSENPSVFGALGESLEAGQQSQAAERITAQKEAYNQAIANATQLKIGQTRQAEMRDFLSDIANEGVILNAYNTLNPNNKIEKFGELSLSDKIQAFNALAGIGVGAGAGGDVTNLARRNLDG